MSERAARVPNAMPDHMTPAAEVTGDPWQAFGHLVSGVLLYGLLGWGADRWLGTTWLVAVGMVLGAGIGTYMIWAQLREPQPQVAEKTQENVS